MTDLFAHYAASKATANGPGLARADAPDTSTEAALSVAEVTGGYKLRVLHALHSVGPMTAELLENATGLKGNTVRPRLKEMEKADLVRKSGEIGLTSAGRKAEKWTITNAGVIALEHIERKAET